MRAIVMIAGALALAGCQTAGEQGGPAAQAAAGDPIPVNYRQIVAAHIRANFIDPYSIRDASIAPPVRGSAYVEGTLGMHEAGWAVCVRANSKNRMGGYTGTKPTMFIIRGQKVVASQTDEYYVTRTTCGADAAYEVFPEIEERRGRS
jgi:hypothetical protein